MGMMTHMRDRMHVVLWALLILFLLSMSIGGLVGGANVIDQLMGKVDPRKAIGVVNGTNLPPDQFMRMVNAELEQSRIDGREITDQQLNTIREQVWDRMVNEILISEVLADLNISATNAEILFHLQENPPAFLTNMPDFQTDGQFDPAKYQQAVLNPQGNEWLPVENHLKNVFIPNFKLEQLLNSSATATEAEVLNEFIKRNIDYNIDAIHVLNSSFTGEDVEPSEKEIEAAYKRDLEDYFQEEQRHLRYVSWEKIPTRSDSNSVYEDALAIKMQVEAGADFAELANQFTEDPSNAVTDDSGRGGNMGWFSKTQMVGPFSEAAFAARPGAIVGPVLTRFGYHVIKVIDRRKQDGLEEVNAAHILFKIGLGPNTREELRRTATLFSYDSQDYGFDAALDTHSVTSAKAMNVQSDAIFVSGLGQFRNAVRFAFNEEIGVSSTPLENDQYYVVLMVDSITPAGTQQLAQVEAGIKNTLQTEKQAVAAEKFLTDLKPETSAARDFNNLKTSYDKIEVISGETRTLNRSFSSLGRSNYVTGALMNAEAGEVVGPLKTMRGFALVRLNSVAEIDSTELEVQVDALKNELISRKQRQIYNDWVQGLKDDAKIVDNRKYYF